MLCPVDFGRGLGAARVAGDLASLLGEPWCGIGCCIYGVLLRGVVLLDSEQTLYNLIVYIFPTGRGCSIWI